MPRYVALYLYFDLTLLHMILHAVAFFFLGSSLLFLLRSSSDPRYFLRLYPFFPYSLCVFAFFRYILQTVYFAVYNFEKQQLWELSKSYRIFTCAERGNDRFRVKMLHPRVSSSRRPRKRQGVPIWRRLRSGSNYGIRLRKRWFGHRGSCTGRLQWHRVCIRTNRLRQIAHNAWFHRTYFRPHLRGHVDGQRANEILGPAELPWKRIPIVELTWLEVWERWRWKMRRNVHDWSNKVIEEELPQLLKWTQLVPEVTLCWRYPWKRWPLTRRTVRLRIR